MLSKVHTERRFHGRLRRDLPALSVRKLHLKFRDKIVERSVGLGLMSVSCVFVLRFIFRGCA